MAYTRFVSDTASLNLSPPQRYDNNEIFEIFVGVQESSQVFTFSGCRLSPRPRCAVVTNST